MSGTRQQIQARLADLQREYRAGEDQLRGLARQEAALRETLLRISGAIQVLNELLVEPTPAPAVDAERTAADPERSAADPERTAAAEPVSPEVLTVP